MAKKKKLPKLDRTDNEAGLLRDAYRLGWMACGTLGARAAETLHERFHGTFMRGFWDRHEHDEAVAKGTERAWKEPEPDWSKP